ncbi:MAG: hypothetical protein V7756_17445 [Halopseudomonas sp.]|uniref:hypothetical protein n=1 Tax=Halopseudomonas sp. TaxID=2901191 RepID=UPI003003659D
MVTHFMHDGHLACGREGDLTSSKTLNKVKCRNCRNTDAYKQARRDQRNAARRKARHAAAGHDSNSWRTSWSQRLTQINGPQRLPRGFGQQAYV